MKLPFVSRRRHQADVDALNADRERLRGERDQFAKDRDAFKAAAQTAARQFAEADAANRRLAGRNKELQDRAQARGVVAQQRGTALGKLGNRLSNIEGEYSHIDGYAARVEERLDRALKAAARYLSAYHAETVRADRLQQRLDDACGLNDPAVAAGELWQKRRDDKRGMTKEAAS